MLEYEETDILEGMKLIKQIYQKSVIFVTIGVLKVLVLNMNLIFVMDIMI